MFNLPDHSARKWADYPGFPARLVRPTIQRRRRGFVLAMGSVPEFASGGAALPKRLETTLRGDERTQILLLRALEVKINIRLCRRIVARDLRILLSTSR